MNQDHTSKLRYVVEQLISDALLVANGQPPADEALATVVEDQAHRLTPLDPRRPAPDLLEDLVTCVDAAFVVWRIRHDDIYDDMDEEEVDDESVDAPLRNSQWGEFTTALQQRAHAHRRKIGLAEPPGAPATEVG